MFQQKSQISVNAEIETNRIGKILSLFKHQIHETVVMDHFMKHGEIRLWAVKYETKKKLVF